MKAGSVIVAFVLAMLLGATFVVVGAQQQSWPEETLNPVEVVRPEVAKLQQQALDLANELLHAKTDLATCKATVDSLTLTSQALDLIKRYESTVGGKWTWDDKTQRVIQEKNP